MSLLIDQWMVNWLKRRLTPSNRLMLNRHRIYIIPSRLGASVAIMAFILFIFGTNYQNNLILLLSFFVLSVFIIIMMASYRNLSGLILQTSSALPVAEGEALSFELTLTSDRVREGLMIEWQTQLAESLAAKNMVPIIKPLTNKQNSAQIKICVSCELYANQRGIYALSWLKIISYAPLSFFRVWAVMRSNAKGVVYPEPKEGPLPLLISISDALNNSEEDWQALKVYQSGDSLSRVYWRRYALNRELWVRGIHEFNTVDDIIFPEKIILDFNAPNLDKYSKDQRLAILCYWVLWLSERNMMFALHLPAYQLSENSGYEHKISALTSLAVA